MNFNELKQEVFNITNRPDLEAETSSALKAATLKAHTSDFYFRDVYETEIHVEEAAFIHSLDLYSVIPNLRSLKYVRYYDVASGGTPEDGTFLEVITPEEVLDSYNRNRVDVAYQAGRMLEMRGRCEFKDFVVGVYVMPIVTPEGDYSSWIAQMHPFAIINEAARVIFKLIGYDEQSAQYNALVAEEYATLKITGLAQTGH